MLGESKRGAQNQSMLPSVETKCRSLQVSDQAVIGDQWVVRHLGPRLRKLRDVTMLCQLSAANLTRMG